MQKTNRLRVRLGVWEFRAGLSRRGLKGRMAWVEKLESLSFRKLLRARVSVTVKKGFWAGEGHWPKFRFSPGHIQATPPSVQTPVPAEPLAGAD